MKFGSWTYDGNQVKCLVHSLVHGTRVHRTPSTPFTLYTSTAHTRTQSYQRGTQYQVQRSQSRYLLHTISHTPIHAHAQTIKHSQEKNRKMTADSF